MSVDLQLRRVFGALDDHGVTWCLLRGERGLAAPSGDVDLLVSGGDLSAAEEALFALGYAALPRGAGSWHRFYLRHDRGTGHWVKLDLVTELTFGREDVVRSGLESGCLARRRRVDGVWRLQEADQFWTVVLHCMLDKGLVTARRADELTDLVGALHRPSDGERFLTDTLGDPAAADQVLEAVRRRDWPALLAVAGPRLRSVPVGGPRSSRRARLRDATARAARPLYPALWRLSGLGAEPRVAEVVTRCPVDAVVAEVRRRPLGADVTIVVRDTDLERLCAALGRARFRRRGREWVHGGPGRVERVLVEPASRWWPSVAAVEAVFGSARPLRGRRHWLLPVGDARRLLAGATGAA